MRILKILAFVVLTATGSIVFAQDVKTDHDRAVNFSAYKTFMWIKEPNTTNLLMKQRIVDAINLELGEKGLRLVTSGGDLGVSANSATHERHTLTTFYDGFPGGWGWRHRWGGPATTYVDTYQVGTLVVDLFDTSNKRVVWRGTATDTVSDKPEKNEKHLYEAVAKMFKDFPPKVHS